MSDEYQLRKDIDELQRDSARLNNTLDEANVLIDDLKDIDKKFDNYYDSSVIDELLDEQKALAMGLPIFNINEEGELVAELGLFVDNYFSINSNGELVVSFDGNNPFTINDNGFLVYNGDVA